MRILIVNDDGIASPLLHLLAGLSKALGEVTVVAPRTQCSAMSHHITVDSSLVVRPEKDFPVEGVRAFSVDGTPADCTKIAIYYLMEEKPDILFSGINYGVNTGYDICYSGTVHAAIEGAMFGLHAIAWSVEPDKGYGALEAYFPEIAGDLCGKKLPPGYIWNVNFPAGKKEDCKGILYDRIPAQHLHYLDKFDRTDHADGSFTLQCLHDFCPTADDGSDLHAIKNGYISVGLLYNEVMYPKTTKDLF